ncbi:hypothetical protein TVNIR_0685 [Thioalkalivibrio nitratireducens DSM 14787]|uniref:Uncharacterized protein n=1 Tax=Thioalkalivibrio nitratireducens (strain DSM 14787 / UNIQEM 213 / ALEN2) TaxID=1255043 RepID=L0DTP8_THIND|nr:hypothetical protein TVNIR_0685 [Thioalkalivibrio nitratireducens DSM 14787]
MNTDEHGFSINLILSVFIRVHPWLNVFVRVHPWLKTPVALEIRGARR